MQKLPVMFLRCEEQSLGVVEQLPPLLDRHYGQIGACHGGILYYCMGIQYSENAWLHRYCGRNASPMITDQSLVRGTFSLWVAIARPDELPDSITKEKAPVRGL
jgi:hypothetical protein